MVVKKNKLCAIEFTVYTEDGAPVDSNVGQMPLEFTPGQNQILPKLEIALVGKKEGDTLSLELAPEDAYGAISADAFQTVAVDTLPEGYQQVGAILGLQDKDKPEHVFQARVHEINDDQAVLDLNHPLAGKILRFEIKVLKA